LILCAQPNSLPPAQNLAGLENASCFNSSLTNKIEGNFFYRDFFSEFFFTRQKYILKKFLTEQSSHFKSTLVIQLFKSACSTKKYSACFYFSLVFLILSVRILLFLRVLTTIYFHFASKLSSGKSTRINRPAITGRSDGVIFSTGNLLEK